MTVKKNSIKILHRIRGKMVEEKIYEEKEDFICSVCTTSLQESEVIKRNDILFCTDCWQGVPIAYLYRSLCCDWSSLWNDCLRRGLCKNVKKAAQ